MTAKTAPFRELLISVIVYLAILLSLLLADRLRTSGGAGDLSPTLEVALVCGVLATVALMRSLYLSIFISRQYIAATALQVVLLFGFSWYLMV
jgi:hypothetical protein